MNHEDLKRAVRTNREIIASDARKAILRKAYAGLPRLEESERSTLLHCLQIAARTFDDHARTMRETDDNPMMTKQALRRLAEQFDLQAKQARDVAERIDDAYAVLLAPDTIDE